MRKSTAWTFIIPGVIIVLLAAYVFIQQSTAPTPPAQNQIEQPGINPAPEMNAPQPSPEITTVTGTFAGRADNNFIEVMVNNKPMVFLAPIDNEKELGITDTPEGGEASLDYFVNDKEQNVLVKMRPL